MTFSTELPDRGVIEIAGEDRASFLQGLVSNDVERAVPGQAVWAALLTPQGKYLADFFIFSDGGTLLLDCERAQAPMLVQKLSRFRLRAKVTVALRDDLSVYAGWGGAAPAWSVQAGIAAADPRLGEAGWRALTTTRPPTNATARDWDRHRLALGLPDGTRDLEVDKTILLEANFDELNGVSWTKGCYMGQELTARTKYRGLLKRRLVPVRVAGSMPPPGAAIFRDDGTEAGTLHSSHGDMALATLRLGALAGRLTCDGASLTPQIPGWMRLTEIAG